MNRVYLIRHGENTANLTLEFSHRRVDYSLTPKGVLQAEQTAAALQHTKIDAVYSSPLRRALETAQIIAAPHGLPVIPVEAFREVNVGDLEGQPPTADLWNLHNQIMAGWMNGHPELCFPGGENCLTLISRFRAGLEQILTGKQGRTILIAGHGGLFYFTLAKICTGVDPAILGGGISNCAIIELEAQMNNGVLEVHLLSGPSIDHLSGEAANLVSGLLERQEGDSE